METIFQTIGQMTFILDPQYRILKANRAVFQALGLAETEVIGHRCHALFHGQEEPPDCCPNQRLGESNQAQTVDMEFEALGRTYLVSCTPVVDSEGDLTEIIHIATDITARKQAEADLVDSESRSRRFLDDLPGSVFAHDMEGRFLLVNRTACRNLGYSEDELLGMTVEGIDPDAVERDDRRVYWEKLKPGETVTFIARHRKRDGTTYPAEIRLCKLQFGEIETILANAQDISQRLNSEKGVRTATAILDRSPAVAFLWRNEPGWPVEFVTENVSRLFGYTAAEFLSGRVEYYEVIHPEDRDRVAEDVACFIESRYTGSFVHEPYRIRTRDGSILWVDDRTEILRNANGEITHFQGLVLDVTVRKNAEILLKASEERFRTLLGQSADAIFLSDMNGRVLSVNNQACRSLGYTSNELLSMSIHDVDQLHTEPKQVREIIERLPAGRSNIFESRHRRKDGSIFPVEINVGLLPPEDRRQALFIARNLSAQKEAHSQLEQLRAIFRTVSEISSQAIISVDPEGRVIHWSQSAERLFGWREDEVIGKPNPAVPAESENDFENDVRTAISNGTTYTRQASLLSKDGSLMEVSISGAPLVDECGNVLGAIHLVTDVICRENRQEKMPVRHGQCGTSSETGPDGYPADKLAHGHDTGGSETILLVEEKKIVRRLAARALGSLGYRVIEAESAEEAFNSLKRSGIEIDLLLTDVEMNAFNGRDLSEQLRFLAPDIRVLFMSGFMVDTIERHGLQKNGEAHIRKPFRPAELARKIRHLLDT